MNCILPGIVATKIIPPEMIAAVSPEWLVTVPLAMTSPLDPPSHLLQKQTLNLTSCVA